MYGGHWFGGGFMWIFFIIFIGLIIWLLNIYNRGVNTEKSALDYLKERYAKGEINKEEYEQKRKDLSG